MAFEFTEPAAAKLNTITPRTEKHGDEDVFAISLGLQLTGANTLLDKLSPSLRHALYRAEAPEGQDPLPGIEQATPKLRVSVVDMVYLRGALQGWTIAIDDGIDEDDPIELGDCKVDNFRVHPMEGGTVDLFFRVGSNDVDATEAGRLCAHLKQEISFTLRAPTPKDDAAAIDGTTEAFKRDHPLFDGDPEDEDDDGAAADATDIFAAQS